MHGWNWPRATARATAAGGVCALAASLIVTGSGSALAGTLAWKLQVPAAQTLPGGQIHALSCSAASACTAVGSYVDADGLTLTLAERWDGHAWQQQRTPKPAEDTVPAVSPQLRGVSCPASNFCEAVGSYTLSSAGVSLAYNWNGHSWKSQPFPVPAGAESAELDQVSCISAKLCEAVGSFQGTASGAVTLAARWNGTRWRLQPIPSPVSTQPVTLAAISCVSADFCEAAGGSASTSIRFAERWNGTTWHLQAMPGGSNVNSNTVTSVSCVSASFCQAVGSNEGDVWHGSSWMAEKLPQDNLGGVSCLSATFCKATGGDFGDSDATEAATWTGSKWTVQDMPNPRTALLTSLPAISCASVRSCQAAGTFRVGQTDGPIPLDESWNGSGWRIRAAVTPDSATANQLTSVSCVSASFCEAVGNYTDGTGNGQGLAESWDGISWTLQAVPSPATEFSASTQTLTSVSCVSATFCEAAGQGADGPDTDMWDGTSWTRQLVPPGTGELISVSCTAADFCMAAGSFGATVLWDGMSWSAGAKVTGFFPLSAVSCASPTFCEAAGSGPSGENAAVWDGSSWIAQATAGPASTVLSAVSCTAANSCEAVGSQSAQVGFGRAPLAETWDGTAWTAQPVTGPAAAQTSSLDSVWCTSAGSCTAVGQFQYGQLSPFDTLAEVWNGTSWRLQMPRNTRNAGQSLLTGVSCGAAGMCVAVGQTQDIGLTQAPLIEAGD